MRKSSLLLFAAALFLLNCSSEKKSNESLITANIDTVAASHKISEKAIGEIIKSIPSPIEISVLIKESGMEYNSSLLNSSKNFSNYNTNYKRALNLGIYGADLGYINIYKQNKDAIFYLSSIKGLAEDLNIGQFYDFETIKRLATNSNNIDSLLLITTSNFDKINTFLHANKRSDQSILILTGGWLEALYITCELAQKHKSDKLNEKIGEQKIVLDQLMLLLSNFKSEDNIAHLSNELEELHKIYNQIEITYVYKESTMEEINGILTIVDRSESKVNITQEQIAEITRITKKLRDKIVA